MSKVRRAIRSAARKIVPVALVFTALSTLGTQATWASPVATSTSLAVTSGGSAVTTVASVTVVTLTATVTAGGTPVTTGLVNFCDASAARCTDVHILGSAQLTSAGTAAFQLTPRAGSRSYKAVFVGTVNDAGSTSSTAALTVTASAPSVSVVVNGSAGNYSLTAYVKGGGTLPTGTVSFLDTTNSNYVLTTASLFSAFGLHLPIAYATGANPQSVAVGDFNGDGFPDLAVGNEGANTVGILLGNGDGTFGSQVSYAAGAAPDSVAVGDFNGDGVLDLAVANNADGTVSVLLGKGDGTFKPQVVYASGAAPYSVVVGDFNRDGIPDLAVTNPDDNTLSVFLGKGDGTFNAQVVYATGGYPEGLTVADFNGDGFQDLLVANDGDGTIGLLLGKGDGTFQPQVAYSTTAYPTTVAAADFNGDGIPDLAVGNYSDGSLNVLLGKGDGTFTASASYALDARTFSIVAADFNGDGIPDLAVAYSGSGVDQAALLLGNGDGTFQTAVGYPTGNTAASLAVGDFNRDGLPDLAVAVNTNPTVSILLALNEALVDVQGISPAGTGTHYVEASYSGDSIYPAAVSTTTALTAEPAPTTLTLTASPSGATAGQPVTLTATLSPTMVQNHANDGETITFLSNGSSVGTGTLSGGIATFNFTTPTTGTDRVTASYTSDGNFASATSSPLTFVGTPPPAPAVALALTAGGNTVSTVVSGTAVTLTATVAVNSTPVTTGQVNFCDASAAHCTGIHLLGTAQLTAAGTATLHLRPGPGSRSFKAVFLATLNYSGSSSSVQTLTVGAAPTVTTIAQSGSAGNYTLTATVAGGAPAPAGNVSFLDATNANYVLGMASLGAASQGFAAQVPYAAGSAPINVAAGDFNGDGIPDLAVANYSASTVGILLGNGDGTFNAQVAYATAKDPFAIAVGDFNGDGIADLAIGNYIGQSISVLLGRGDGTFLPQVAYPTGTIESIAAGDFNGDGIPDLAFALYAGGGVGVMLGNGDGTFGQESVYATGRDAKSVAIGDFNGDGIPDLAVANYGVATMSVLLGNGDGTFQNPVAYSTGVAPSSVAAGDFNGDGILDLAVANTNGATVSVFLGKGDGTFNPQVTYAAATSPKSVAIGDFNADGILDLALATGSGVDVLLGNGDGTFGAHVTYPAGTQVYSVAVGDFNGDGLADVVSANEGSANVSVLLNRLSASASVTGVSPAGTGTHSVEAAYGGNGNSLASTSATTALTAQPVATTLSLAASPAGSSGNGQQVTLTATLSPYTVQGHATDGETITFLSNGNSIGMGTLSGGVATLNVRSLALGMDTLTAAYTSDGIFDSAPTNPISYMVAPGGVWVGNATGSLSLFNLAGDPSSPTAFTGGGLGSVSGSGAIAFDAAGDGWVANANGVSEFNYGGTALSASALTGGGVNAPSAVAVDGAGNVWVANGNGTLSELSNGGAALSPSTGYAAAGTATGVAIDISGNVWVGQTGGTVTELIGAAAPASPPAVALQKGTTGVRP